jgi:hypothetical protein
MNKTEREYAQILQLREASGEIIEWSYEAITLKVGPRCRYTPDFYAIRADGTIEFHEVKGGYIREDAIVKLRAAVGRFNRFVWIMAQKKRGKWIESEL